MKKLSYRYLRGYTLDPGFSSQLDTMNFNQTVYRIRWEDLKKPSRAVNASKNLTDPKDFIDPICINGEYFEIIDVDPPSNCYYEAVNLNSIEVLSQNGLQPDEGNPKFHQQFVYTIAMKTLDSFEKALGRKVIWSPRIKDKKTEYVAKIRIYPHGTRDANAYYDSNKKALIFGYFKASSRLNAKSFPGGAVFTCLSPDIIAHEVTHAILDSIHPRFLESTNSDVAAFHEAFSDIIALLQRFTITELVESQLRTSKGDLNEFNLLGDLATQFGNALPNGHGALRSAIGSRNKDGKWERKRPDSSLYHSVETPHERGSLLVAAFFDALIKVYTFKTEDLLRIASNGTGILPSGQLSYDLTKRLAQELCQIAGHLLNIAIRALDYCPPVDITFGDYFRALITADMDAAPADDNNYRVAFMESFRDWGIFPDRVNTFSEESLRWSKPDDFNNDEKIALDIIAQKVEKEVRVILGMSDREAIFNKYNNSQLQLHDLLDLKENKLGPEKWSTFLKKLGLTDKPIIYLDNFGKEMIPINAFKIEVHKIRPAYRIGREGNILEQVIVTLTQKAEVALSDKEKFRFRGGCTLIFNLADNFNLDYIITKNISSQRRFLTQLNYQKGNDTHAFHSFDGSMYDDDCFSDRINFSKLHFHDNL
ncbi:hypothetical protein LNP22_13355 [Flavobacterium flavipigmentatum]|uniref:hypothetical protein n=1 Tax=Flavobacterium flavipigmentatum TaxID=2893884 RepID=UPI001E2E17BF|nr:hypothetical protein [Flavobacterium sp. F-70]UFH37719.1 hypothetical protein LNP22_13355 [Flavobacterium sp. F-70]